MKTSDESDGICLGDETRWVINGISEFEPFFRNLTHLLPQVDSVVYLEGVSLPVDVRKFLEKNSISAWHEVFRGTIWPKPSMFHLLISPKILSDLAELASRHVNPEIADHCHVYTKAGMILQWYDACDPECPIGVGPDIPEANVKTFCNLTGATYTPHAAR
jgi:hypothetical protein